MLDELFKEVDALIAETRASLADKKVTLVEGLGILSRGVAVIVVLARDVVPSLSDESFKDAVKKAAQKFYEEVVRPLDIPGIPNFIENTLVDPMIGTAIPSLIDMLFEAAFNALQINDEDHLLLSAGSAVTAPAECDKDGECKKRRCCKKLAQRVAGKS